MTLTAFLRVSTSKSVPNDLHRISNRSQFLLVPTSCNCITEQITNCPDSLFHRRVYFFQSLQASDHECFRCGHCFIELACVAHQATHTSLSIFDTARTLLTAIVSFLQTLSLTFRYIFPARRQASRFGHFVYSIIFRTHTRPSAL